MRDTTIDLVVLQKDLSEGDTLGQESWNITIEIVGLKLQRRKPREISKSRRERALEVVLREIHRYDMALVITDDSMPSVDAGASEKVPLCRPLKPPTIGVNIF